MSKPRRLERMVDIPLYPARLFISISDNAVAARKKRADLFGECHLGDECNAIAAFKGGDFGIFLERGFSVPILAHEAFHVATRIMEMVGTPLCHETQEPYAYLLSWVVNEVEKLKGER